MTYFKIFFFFCSFISLSSNAQIINYFEKEFELMQNHEAMIPFKSWHSPNSYSQQKIDSFNEQAYGFGMSKYYIDSNNSKRSFYAIAFLDSHSNVQPAIGYTRLFNTLNSNEYQASFGYTAMITARKDLLNYLPVPAILPVFSIGTHKLSLNALYVPPFVIRGDVALFWLQYSTKF